MCHPAGEPPWPRETQAITCRPECWASRRPAQPLAANVPPDVDGAPRRVEDLAAGHGAAGKYQKSPTLLPGGALQRSAPRPKRRRATLASNLVPNIPDYDCWGASFSVRPNFKSLRLIRIHQTIQDGPLIPVRGLANTGTMSRLM